MSGTILSVLTGGVSSLLGPVVNRLADLIPDPVAKAQAMQELQEKMLAADQAMQQQQDQINANEASNNNMFVSGWRPFIGWVCGVGLAWSVFVGPLFQWIANLFGSKVQAPTFNTDSLMSILIPMLGLGAYRTVEKLNGVAGGLASAVRSYNLAKSTAKSAAKAASAS
jgi:hypothetical protein